MPSLRQVFNYQPTSQTAYSDGTDAYINPLAGGGMQADSPEMAALLASGAIRSNANMYGGDGAGGGDMGYTIDYDKLPMADINGKPMSPQYLTPTDAQGSNLIDPRMVAHDNNYGYVSRSTNNAAYKPNGIWDLLYGVLPSLFIAGMGGMAASAIPGMNVFNNARQLISTGSSLANGGKPNPISLAQMAIRAVGPGN